jgi:integrase
MFIRVFGMFERPNIRQNDEAAQNTETAGSGSDRKHLTGLEIDRLIAATKGDRNEARDRCLLLLMFRHGLRVSEACRLKLDQVNIESRVLHITRLKCGLSTTQPLARRRAQGNRCMAETTHPDEDDRQELLRR